MIGYLGPGGAERQIVYLAKELSERGWKVALIAFSLDGDGAHFAAPLREAGVRLFALDRGLSEIPSLRLPARLAGGMAQLARAPDEVRLEVFKAAAILRLLRPDLVIAFLDRVNMVGALAARIAGVRRVILSARNLNPSHFPYLDRPWFQDLYRRVLSWPGVTLMANSRAGARSYEQWLGVGCGRIPVIHNGMRSDILDDPAPEAVAALRRGLASEGGPLVLGVFRLSPEKRPEQFFALLERLRAWFPGLRAVVAGTGIDFDAHKTALLDSGRGDFISLLGRRDDMACLYRAADLMVHVSEAEGVPNAVMEAQWMGCAVAGTLGGGTGEILAPSQHRWFHDLGDLDGVAQSCRALLADGDLRVRVGAQSQDFARRTFGSDAMVRAVLALAAAPGTPQVEAGLEQSGALAEFTAVIHGGFHWLRLCRPRWRLRHLLLHAWRPAFGGDVEGIWHDGGHCFQAPLPRYLISDAAGRSRLRLFEDGVELGPAHSGHDAIRNQGGGRYSHWERWLYFSTPDGTDPRVNGRRYTVKEQGRHDQSSLV